MEVTGWWQQGPSELPAGSMGLTADSMGHLGAGTAAHSVQVSPRWSRGRAGSRTLCHKEVAGRCSDVAEVEREVGPCPAQVLVMERKRKKAAALSLQGVDASLCCFLGL